MKLGDAKEQLNNPIRFVQRNKNEEITAYYDHLSHMLSR
jgi:hypothetical protein